jgi:formate/nitrite transporter FocA (FNT family)
MMLSRGSVLYRDVFSHHFPFAYYWIAIVTGLFGPSIAAARVSVLLFEIGSFAWVMYLTRYFTPIGVLCLLWNIVGLFFFSNLVLYTGFTSVALTAAFIVTIAILSKRIAAGRKELLTLGIFATVAVLSNLPFTILCSTDLSRPYPRALRAASWWLRRL